MLMSETVTQKRSGGVIWLIVFACIGILWMSSLDVWPTMLLGWLIVGIAFAYVRTLQQYINRHQTVSVICLTIATAIGLWIVGKCVSQCALAIRTDVKYANSYALLLTAMLVAGAAGWLLAAAFVRGAAEREGAFSRIVVGAWNVVRIDKRIWPLGLLTSVFHMLTCLIAYNCGNAMQLIVGIAAGFVQVKMLGVINSPASRNSLPDQDQVSQAQKVRLYSGLSVLFIQILFMGFYLILAIMTHASFGYSWVILLVLPWVCGAIYSLFTWIIGLFRPLYFLVLITIVIANAILLGVMIGIFDSMLFT